ncbi:CAP domain-containing protein [Streptomyces netropsis]|uniref:CAP domain-containing protein n=1 Tax=Streptomyces netropsis TaxID=55404 RepID=UPI0030CDE583
MTLVVAGADADLPWWGEGFSELSPSDPFGRSRTAEIDWSTPARTSVIAEFRRMLLELANAERRAHGCKPLKSDPRLQRSAQSHVDDMALRNYHDHNSPQGANPGDRMLAAGYHWSAWGENLLRGSLTPAATMQGWLTSYGHRHNILDCAWTDTGIGLNLSSLGPWWAQDFATRG